MVLKVSDRIFIHFPVLQGNCKLFYRECFPVLLMSRKVGWLVSNGSQCLDIGQLEYITDTYFSRVAYQVLAGLVGKRERVTDSCGEKDTFEWEHN